MKKLLFTICLLLSVSAFAEVNEKYSYKDFTGQTFVDVDPSEFVGEIRGSCFYQPDTWKADVFPEGIEASFTYCNLDNVYLPETVEADSCTHKNILMIDGEDWVIADDGTPLYPLNPEEVEE
jgi:hypothetical protein